MVDPDLLLRIGQVLMAAVVAAVPPLYPKWSLYGRRSWAGVKALQEVRDEEVEGDDDELTIQRYWLERGETGFSEVANAIQQNNVLSGKLERIGLEHRKGPGIAISGSAVTATFNEGAEFYVEYADQEEAEVLRERSLEIGDLLRLKDLERWVERAIENRTRNLTAGLAVLWAALAVASAI